MSWKLYISYGMTKCGSTLAFKLTRELFKQNRLTQWILPDELIDGPRPSNFMPDFSKDKLDRVLEIAEERGTKLVIKTHAPPSEAMKDLFRSGQAIGHAVFRDPRDMALSLLDHGERSRREGVSHFANHETLEGTIPAIRRQTGFLKEWMDLPGMRPWYYEDFAFDKVGMIARLRLQTKLKTDTKALIEEFDDRKNMQFNRAVKARWKEDMSAEDAARFEEEFKDIYAQFRIYRRYWWWTRPGPLHKAMMHWGYR